MRPRVIKDIRMFDGISHDEGIYEKVPRDMIAFVWMGIGVCIFNK